MPTLCNMIARTYLFGNATAYNIQDTMDSLRHGEPSYHVVDAWKALNDCVWAPKPPDFLPDLEDGVLCLTGLWLSKYGIEEPVITIDDSDDDSDDSTVDIPTTQPVRQESMEDDDDIVFRERPPTPWAGLSTQSDD